MAIEPINFHWVDAEVARSARPRTADIPFVLANFKSVFDLEGIDADIAEQNELPSIRVLAGDISDWEIYIPGLFTIKKLNNILDNLEEAPKPILVHCLHGKDRTGLVIAAYHVRYGWKKEAAWAEAKKFGYRWYINFGLNRAWKQFCKQEGK